MKLIQARNKMKIAIMLKMYTAVMLPFALNSPPYPK
jgi:hypothetical protein